jgi:hypothetical protein
MPPLEEDASHVGSRRRICTKLSIILFLCCMRYYLSNILKGSLVLPYLFSPSMRGILGMRYLLASRETSSRPNYLYPYLIRDMD